MGKLDKDTVLTSNPMDLKEIPSSASTDRRIRARRLNVSFPINITHQGNPIHGYAEAVNISWSGVLVATNFPVLVGDEFTLEFTLPTFQIPIQTQARVTRIQPEKFYDQPTMIGLAFINLEINVSRMITGFVLEHLEI